MKKSIGILSALCVIFLIGCSKDDTKLYEKSIEDYNKKQVKHVEEYEIINKEDMDSICTITVDKEKKRVMREYAEEESGEALTTILSMEDGKWYSYVNVGDGNWHKNEEVTLQGEEPLTAADIDISEETTYTVEDEKEAEDKKVVKIKISTPVQENIASEMKENGAITEKLLENEEFKKAYDDVVNKKEKISYIWIDKETKELIEMETDVTKEKLLLHYYMKFAQEAPTYEKLPDSVTKVVIYSEDDKVNSIKLPEE